MLSLGTLTSCARTGTDGETGEQSEKVEQGSQDETGDAGTYEGTEGLDFYPLPDGTYGVSKGKTGYLEDIVVPKTYNQKASRTVWKSLVILHLTAAVIWKELQFRKV